MSHNPGSRNLFLQSRTVARVAAVRLAGRLVDRGGRRVTPGPEIETIFSTETVIVVLGRQVPSDTSSTVQFRSTRFCGNKRGAATNRKMKRRERTYQYRVAQWIGEWSRYLDSYLWTMWLSL